jgi:hypothetical protein
VTGLLPIEIRLRLPEGWRSEHPDEVGAPDVAFIAGHPESVDDNYIGTISIKGQIHPNPAPLAAIADRAVDALWTVCSDVEVRDRQEIGSPAAPAMLQVVRLLADIDDTDRRLVRTQVFGSLPYPPRTDRRAVLTFSLTCTPGQFEKLKGDFETFVNTGWSPAGPPRPDPDRIAATAAGIADYLGEIADAAQDRVRSGWTVPSKIDR